MFTISRVVALALPLALGLLVSSPAWAVDVSFVAGPVWEESTVLSGVFDGSEPTINEIERNYCDSHQLQNGLPLLGYIQSTFRVSKSGNYYLGDAFGMLRREGGVDVTALVYEGSFDASTPQKNLITWGGGDFYSSEVNLSAGKTYVLVVQQSCISSEGVWALTFTGPGIVQSDYAVPVPAFTSGAFARDDPTMHDLCEEGWETPIYPQTTRYREVGPFQVSTDGSYYFSAANGDFLCLSVRTAALDPDHPWDNVVEVRRTDGTIELHTGQDYYFVVQQGWTTSTGKFLFVLAPPAPFRATYGLAGSWYNPESPGQGFFLDVFEQLNQIFLGWFTYALNPPANDEFGHRWMTALGLFGGTEAHLAIEWTSGGAFDSAQPVPEQRVDGTILLEFDDCSSGQITYGWGLDGPGAEVVSGAIPIRRHANDAVARCESTYAGPGMPGPL